MAQKDKRYIGKLMTERHKHNTKHGINSGVPKSG